MRTLVYSKIHLQRQKSVYVNTSQIKYQCHTMIYNHFVNKDISQVWPEGHIHPDDIFHKESSRAAGGRHRSSQGAGRVTVSDSTWTEWLI